eukprot:6185440-Pleurochrysis_carterae.AAC.1
MQAKAGHITAQRLGFGPRREKLRPRKLRKLLCWAAKTVTKGMLPAAAKVAGDLGDKCRVVASRRPASTVRKVGQAF